MGRVTKKPVSVENTEDDRKDILLVKLKSRITKAKELNEAKVKKPTKDKLIAEVPEVIANIVPNENKRPLRKRKKDDEKESVVDKKPVDKSKIPKEPKENIKKPVSRSKKKIEDETPKEDIEPSTSSKGRTSKRKQSTEENSKSKGKSEPEKPKSRSRNVRKVIEPTVYEDDEDEEDEEEPQSDIINVKKPSRTTKRTKKEPIEKESLEDQPAAKRKRNVSVDTKSNGAKPKEKVLKNKSTTDLENISFDIEKPWNFKISSWNVGGLRSLVNKGGFKYFLAEKPDIFCLQEVKCKHEELPDECKISGYHVYWLSTKGGYAGVALFTKIMPINVIYGIDDKEQDEDARIITAEYEKFYLMNVYVPNSGRKLVTLPKRMRWEEKFQSFVKKFDERKPVIVCGDMNCSHQEIDLANPKTNKRSAGFTQEERDELTRFLDAGFVDSFRHFYPDREKAYTYWTYMANARARNVGWRLDYFILSDRLMSKCVDNLIRSEIYGSDHCPITLFLNL